MNNPKQDLWTTSVDRKLKNFLNFNNYKLSTKEDELILFDFHDDVIKECS